MDKIRILLVDDEENAIKAMELMINKHLPDFEIAGATTSSVDAITMINDLHPDVLLLDINMPQIDGFELLNALTYKEFQLVIVSAHNHYASEAFKSDAVHYLLKPVWLPELIRMAEKIRQNKKEVISIDNTSARKRIPVRSIDHVEYVYIDEIISIDSYEGYSKIVLGKHSIVSTKTLKEFERIIGENFIMRVHQSHIINLNYVSKFYSRDSEIELSDGRRISLSRRNKDEFLMRMEDFI
jgi:two-component system LytT family response regulator